MPQTPIASTAERAPDRTLSQTFSVSFSYPVVFTESLFDVSNPVLADAIEAGVEPARLLTVIDSAVLEHHPGLPAQIEAYAAAHPELIRGTTAPVVLPGGERAKNTPGLVDRILEAIDARHIDRHAYVLAIGGGSVIDAAGYAAAIAHRGVRLLRVPTTVLAQNDAAVGVKNSVNAFGKKNFLGTFAPPRAVLCDRNFLGTLSDAQWRAGTSEAVKVAVLKDPEFFSFLEEHASAIADRAADPMWELIQRCAALHLDHITQGGDPFELGSSRPLDFGHWAAHRLEHLTHFAVSHGEAVGIGIALDCTYAELAGILPAPESERIIGTLERLGLPLSHPALAETDVDGQRSILAGLQEFQEHLGGQLTITLASAVGAPVDVHEIDEGLMLQAIDTLLARGAAGSAA